MKGVCGCPFVKAVEAFQYFQFFIKIHLSGFLEAIACIEEFSVAFLNFLLIVIECSLSTFRRSYFCDHCSWSCMTLDLISSDFCTSDLNRLS